MRPISARDSHSHSLQPLSLQVNPPTVAGIMLCKDLHWTGIRADGLVWLDPLREDPIERMDKARLLEVLTTHFGNSHFALVVFSTDPTEDGRATTEAKIKALRSAKRKAAPPSTTPQTSCNSVDMKVVERCMPLLEKLMKSKDGSMFGQRLELPSPQPLSTGVCSGSRRAGWQSPPARPYPLQRMMCASPRFLRWRC